MRWSIIISLLFVCLAVVPAHAAVGGGQSGSNASDQGVESSSGSGTGGGNGNGGANNVDVVALFSNAFGSTITDANGTYYNVNVSHWLSWYFETMFGTTGYEPYGGLQVWLSMFEPRIYISDYHFGDPAFVFDTTMTVADALSDPASGVPLYFFGNEVGLMLAVTNNSNSEKTVEVVSEAFSLNTDGTNGQSFGNAGTAQLTIAAGQTTLVDISFVADYAIGMLAGLDRLEVTVSTINQNGNEPPGLIAEYEAIFCPPEVENEIINNALLY